jgi:hypothetical protein
MMGELVMEALATLDQVAFYPVPPRSTEIFEKPRISANSNHGG